MALGQAAWVAADDTVASAKAAVARYAGPQTVWEGPTSAPKADGRHVHSLPLR